ncbi:Receptor expression-enhancing protein 5 [Trichinella zimbabwensis]|uniref:Receptor expression-enhancing protein n=1 Tax=Trichinella zimbabwensis TaxID=268475 RepID=A0A0V1HWH0_9BILA|nr:Receptor expression-enhancing protein 5 [Trichinella zimbabwensis]
MKEIVRNIWADIINAISDQDTFVGKIFGKVEEKSGPGRYQTAKLLAFVIVAFLIFSTSAEVLCNLICFCYPAVKTIMEIEVKEKINFNQWMFYWVVFGLSTISDFFAHFIGDIFPFYWLLKFTFFLWLFMPSCRGAEKLYEKLVKLRCNQHPTDNNIGNKIADTE